jgi:hypothetical protein
MRNGWFWCTENTANPISLNLEHLGHVENDAINSSKPGDDVLSCLAVGYLKRAENGETPSTILTTLCDANDVFLHCESSSKYPPNLLVTTKIF